MENIDKLALWYQISKARFLGPVRFRKLWDKLGDDLGRVFTMKNEDLLKIKGAVTKQNVKGIREQKDKFNESLSFIQRQCDLARDCGGEIITLDDPRYPKVLRDSKMCHALLYYVGDIEKLTYFSKSLAIVGTRKPAPESAKVAFETARNLAKNGWVIISGMANGVDSEAHKGALDAHGKTIAVLGCGPDYVYPPEAKELYEKIKSNGLIISEYPFGTRPEGWKLKKRNKTTVAFASATFVVETSEKGGTMNAVQACREQKKTAFVLLPTWPCDKSGNEKAIKNGSVRIDPAPDLSFVFEEDLTRISMQNEEHKDALF